MIDFNGDNAKIGDRVIFNPPKYKGLCEGKIIKETPKGVRISYINDWNYASGRLEDTFVYDYNFVISNIKK